jgi:hypothetical protein
MGNVTLSYDGLSAVLLLVSVTPSSITALEQPRSSLAAKAAFYLQLCLIGVCDVSRRRHGYYSQLLPKRASGEGCVFGAKIRQRRENSFQNGF